MSRMEIFWSPTNCSTALPKARPRPLMRRCHRRLAGLAEELRPDGPPISSKYRTVDVVRLGPWSPGFAARWLDEEDEIGHKLTGNVELDLARRAGGWPVLLELVRDCIREHGQASRLEADGMSTLLAENAERLRKAFGLDRSFLREALRLVETAPRPEAARRGARVLRPDEQGRLFGSADQISLSEGPTQGLIAPEYRFLLAATVAHVAQWDVRLAERLIGARPESILRPWKILEADVAERGWSEQTPETWEAGTVEGPTSRPLVHSSLLRAKGRLAELNRRLWAAQASALLPSRPARRQPNRRRSVLTLLEPH